MPEGVRPPLLGCDEAEAPGLPQGVAGQGHGNPRGARQPFVAPGERPVREGVGRDHGQDRLLPGREPGGELRREPPGGGPPAALRQLQAPAGQEDLSGGNQDVPGWERSRPRASSSQLRSLFVGKLPGCSRGVDRGQRRRAGGFWWAAQALEAAPEVSRHPR